MTVLACLFLGHAPYAEPLDLQTFGGGFEAAWSTTVCVRCGLVFARKRRHHEPIPASAMTHGEIVEAAVRKVLSETTRQGKQRKTRTKKEEVAP